MTYPLVNVRSVHQAQNYVWDVNLLQWVPEEQAAAGPGMGDGVNILAAGTQTAGTAATILFADSHGLSFGMSNSSRITASYTVPSVAGLLSAVNVSGGTTSNNLSAFTFSNANGVSFGLNASTLTASVAAGATATGNLGAVAAGTQTATSGTIAFSNSNGISFGMSGSTRLTASHDGLTSQSNQAISAANGSFAFQTVTFSNANGVSFGTSAGSAITASIATSLTNIRVSAGTTSNLLSALTFSNAVGGVSFGLNGSVVTASAPAGAPSPVNFSAGTTSSDLGSVVFSNSNGVSFGLNGSTVTASVNAAGGGATLSFTDLVPSQSYGLAQLGNGSFWVQPMLLPCALSVSRVNLFASFSISSSSNSSHGGTLSVMIGIYTRNVSTLSLSTSGSGVYNWTNTSNNSTQSLAGLRQITASIAANLSAGDYWVAVGSRTSTANANWWTASNMVQSALNSAYSGPFALATNASMHIIPGQGIFSATSSVPPSSMAIADVRGSSVNNRSRPIINLVNFE